MLGFQTRREVDGFLKEHGVNLEYTVEGLDREAASSRPVWERGQVSQPNLTRMYLRAPPPNIAQRLAGRRGSHPQPLSTVSLTSASNHTHRQSCNHW